MTRQSFMLLMITQFFVQHTAQSAEGPQPTNDAEQHLNQASQQLQQDQRELLEFAHTLKQLSQAFDDGNLSLTNLHKADLVKGMQREIKQNNDQLRQLQSIIKQHKKTLSALQARLQSLQQEQQSAEQELSDHPEIPGISRQIEMTQSQLQEDRQAMKALSVLNKRQQTILQYTNPFVFKPRNRETSAGIRVQMLKEFHALMKSAADAADAALTQARQRLKEPPPTKPAQLSKQ